MADIEIDDRGTVLLPGAHRVVRNLDSSEGPFAGALVTRGDGVAVRVDASALAGWVGWRFAGAEHVAGPVDVLRRVDGHDALLPWCTDQVLGFLVRRTAAGRPLTSGEATTLVISVLRGLDEVGERVEEAATGVWWLTDGGRPLFVTGEGTDARTGAAQVVQRLEEDVGDKALGRVLSAVHQGLRKALAQPRVPRRLLEEWERELLEVAAPRPLERAVYAPESARGVARAVSEGDRRRESSRAQRRTESRDAASARRRRPEGLKRSVGTVQGVVETIARVVDRRREAMRAARPEERPQADAGTRTSRRRRVLILAGAAAAVVLVGGLLWPGDGTGDSADAARGASATTEQPEQSAQRPAGDSASARDAAIDSELGAADPTPSVGPDSPEAAASRLLALIVTCRAAEDAVCADAVAEGSFGIVEALAPIAEITPAVALVDEYGDVAVVRLGSPDDSIGEEKGQTVSEPDQMLVLVRQDEKWLVRDVYGVADQPG